MTSRKNTYGSSFCPAILVLFLLMPAQGQDVIRITSASDLGEAWKAAGRQVIDRNLRDVWIGYSIDKQMRERSWVGTMRSASASRHRSLLEILTGEPADADDHSRAADFLKDEARKALKKANTEDHQALVTKEIAFLFRYDGDPSSIGNLITIRTTNIELPVELDDVPLIWIGKRETDDSFRHLQSLFSDASSRKTEKKLIAAVGLHGPDEDIFRFLKGVVEGDRSMEAREDAVFWISQQGTEKSLQYLLDLAMSTDEKEIMERAVFGVSQFGGRDATDALIRIGRNGRTEQLRKKAVFWLGQQASEKIAGILRDFAYDDRNIDVQEQAVFALSQLRDGEGIDDMIRIARTHPHPRIRKQAIFWLSQSGDLRAFEALVSIAKGD